MNKTVNINLGGMFFHIDEDAYQKLTRYFDAIKRSLSNSGGQDEIIKDIEMRIAELIGEKHTNEKQVINVREVEEIITIMGQPEDYKIDADDEPRQKVDFDAPIGRGTKKLYRDKDGAMVGGVLSGLGYYFGIDKVWLRIILLILVCFYGTGILAYIILWIVMPEALTTSEKLEMRGEPVTISNIEKKVREEFETVSEKFKSANYDKMGKQVKTGAERAAGSLGDFILTILKIFAKILGVLLIMWSLAMLVILFIGVFTLGSTAFIEFPWQDFVVAGNLSGFPIWTFGLLMFMSVGIPFFFLAILGFKLLSPEVKSIGNVAKYTLLALWLISIAILVSIGIRQATEYAVEGRVIEKVNIPLAVTDTLYIKFKHNDYFADDIHDSNDFMITDDSLGNNVIYSNDVRFNIEKTNQKTAYIQIEKQAKGKSISAAKRTAEQIKYGFTTTGNQVILDNYLLTDFGNKYRDQEVEITLYLPVGTIFKPDSSIQDYDNSDDEFFNLHYSGDYIYKLEGAQIKCLTCPPDENEYGDVNGGYTPPAQPEDPIAPDAPDGKAKVILNEEGILIKSASGDQANEVKSVKINKDGITIKTE